MRRAEVRVPGSGQPVVHLLDELSQRHREQAGKRMICHRQRLDNAVDYLYGRTMRVVSIDTSVTFETPNAIMRTYASPVQGGSALAVWRTVMAPGSAGPSHALSSEQTIVVLEGRLRLESADEAWTLATGDSITIPAAADRRVRNAGDTVLVTLSAALPGATAQVGEAEPVPVPWTT